MQRMNAAHVALALAPPPPCRAAVANRITCYMREHVLGDCMRFCARNWRQNVNGSEERNAEVLDLGNGRCGAARGCGRRFGGHCGYIEGLRSLSVCWKGARLLASLHPCVCAGQESADILQRSTRQSAFVLHVPGPVMLSHVAMEM